MIIEGRDGIYLIHLTFTFMDFADYKKSLSWPFLIFEQKP